MERRDFGEWRARLSLERGERRREASEEGGSFPELRVGEVGARIGGMQVRWLAAL